jgi:hypothetical protein
VEEELYMAAEEKKLAAEQGGLEGELRRLEVAWEWDRLNGGFDSCTQEEQETIEQKAREVAVVGAKLNQVRSLRVEAARVLSQAGGGGGGRSRSGGSSITTAAATDAAAAAATAAAAADTSAGSSTSACASATFIPHFELTLHFGTSKSSPRKCFFKNSRFCFRSSNHAQPCAIFKILW